MLKECLWTKLGHTPLVKVVMSYDMHLFIRLTFNYWNSVYGYQHYIIIIQPRFPTGIHYLLTVVTDTTQLNKALQASDYEPLLMDVDCIYPHTSPYRVKFEGKVIIAMNILQLCHYDTIWPVCIVQENNEVAINSWGTNDPHWYPTKSICWVTPSTCLPFVTTTINCNRYNNIFMIGICLQHFIID